MSPDWIPNVQGEKEGAFVVCLDGLELDGGGDESVTRDLDGVCLNNCHHLEILAFHERDAAVEAPFGRLHELAGGIRSSPGRRTSSVYSVRLVQLQMRRH